MKKLVSFLILCLLVAHTAYPTNVERKKVGLVLSGGGAKGMAHIGVLKVIEEAGIPIDYVVGTSMGSIIGGLYAIGYTPAQMDSMVRVQDWAFLLSDKTPRSDKNMAEREADEQYIISLPFSKTAIKEVTGGLIKGQNLANLFSELTLGYHDSIDFNQLPVPFACVSEDIAKGKEMVFHEGVLATAMRASMAIPGVFTPVRLDSMVLVDGGVVNNYPVNVARQMGADVIIGVDVQSELKPANELNSATSILGQLVDLMGQDLYLKNLQETDTYIKVNVKGYSAASFNPQAIDTLIIRGEEAARANYKGLKQLKKEIGLDEHYQPVRVDKYEPTDWVMVQNINFNGLDEKDKEWIMKRCDLKENALNSIRRIEETTSIIRANTSYSSVTYNLTHSDDGRFNLNYFVNKKQEHRINIGIRFDSEEIASLLLNVRSTLKTKLPSYISATARLGKRYAAKLSYGIEPSPLSSLGLTYLFQYNDVDHYEHGKRAFNSTFRYHMGEIAYYNVWLRNVRFGLGVRYELYDYEKFLHEEGHQGFDLNKEHFFSYFAGLHYESYDKAYFPSKGVMFNGAYTLYTDNFTEYKDQSPFSEVSGAFEGVIPVTNRFAILPALYGRFLIGNNIPLPKMNVMGGDIAERFLLNQLPFIGVTHVELMKNSLLIGSIKLRQRMGNIHYLTLSGNYALNSNKLKGLLKEDNMFGCGIGYGIDSMFGPLEATLNYATHSNKVNLYVNLGYKF
ncbi:MAG: patatin-like phospholipase family protein [Bacteroidaceae bacterium]|nr:patatin-like phospholipase family protein [Bacteroidaceae bacterium]